MMLMCSMAKPLWGSGKRVIMESFFYLLKDLLVFLIEGSIEVNWPIRIDIGQQKFMDMESMSIVK